LPVVLFASMASMAIVTGFSCRFFCASEKVRALLVYNDEAPVTPGALPDGDGEETAAAADGQSVTLVETAVKHLDALRAALLEKK
jgi:hypothetical protein